MKKDIRQKLKCIGNIKGNQASFILKELLGHCSVVDKDQIDILERLRFTASSGDDIIIDLRENNGKKTAYDDFWDVSVVYLDFFSSHSLLFQNHYIQLLKFLFSKMFHFAFIYRLLFRRDKNFSFLLK